MTYFSQLMITGIMMGGVYGLMAVGVIIIVKASGVFNFAHGTIVVFGAFVFWWFLVPLGLPLWVSILLLFLWSALLGFLIERLVLRPLIGQPLLAAAMATIALGEIFNGVVVLFWPGPGRVYKPPFLPKGAFHAGGVVFPYNQLVCFIACMVALGIFIYFFQFTRQGLAMRAASQDHQLARSAGISVTRVFMISWFIAVLTAATGGIIAGSFMSVDPSLAGLGLYAFPAVIFGGLESIGGGVVGGISVGVLQNLGGGYLDQYVGGGIKEIAPYVIMLLILIFKPHGLFGYKKIERV
jgi:branched-chain amino acid transport system permease protein